jgi:DNA-binding NarL/FixJ family response regulator
MKRVREVRPGKNQGAGDALTRRQREVLQLPAKGFEVKVIAATLNASSKTVEFHKYRTMVALEMRTVADLTRHA